MVAVEVGVGEVIGRRGLRDGKADSGEQKRRGETRSWTSSGKDNLIVEEQVEAQKLLIPCLSITDRSQNPEILQSRYAAEAYCL